VIHEYVKTAGYPDCKHRYLPEFQKAWFVLPIHNEAWFNPLTSGQGFLISVFPDTRMVFLAWFTFDVERPPEDQGNTANLTVFVTSGGGTIKLEFADCKNGLVSYEITSLGISGEIPIERIVQDNVALCELLGSQ
jgi:hypothetical protein